MDRILDVPEIPFLVCKQVALSQHKRGRENLRAVALTNRSLSGPAREVLLGQYYVNSFKLLNSFWNQRFMFKDEGLFQDTCRRIKKLSISLSKWSEKAQAAFFVEERQASFQSLRELLVKTSGAQRIPDLLFDVLFPLHALGNVTDLMNDVHILERTICDSLTKISTTRIPPRKILLQFKSDITRFPTSDPNPETEGEPPHLPQSILALAELTNVDVHVTLDLAEVKTLPSFCPTPVLSYIASLGNVRSLSMVNGEIDSHVWTENVTVDPVHRVFQTLQSLKVAAPNEFCVDILRAIKTEALNFIHIDSEYTLAARASFGQVLELVPTSKHTLKDLVVNFTFDLGQEGYRHGFEGSEISDIDLGSLPSFRALENVVIIYHRGVKVGNHTLDDLARAWSNLRHLKLTNWDSTGEEGEDPPEDDESPSASCLRGFAKHCPQLQTLVLGVRPEFNREGDEDQNELEFSDKLESLDLKWLVPDKDKMVENWVRKLAPRAIVKIDLTYMCKSDEFE
ncbi:hypothetical protein DL96DRAFT_1610715 [Flagelloscypha sp. PMI_526]|nr:hypothetical protein DL96DRAFT_1610715 [Flagelloscypha sp. PMI_526]